MESRRPCFHCCPARRCTGRTAASLSDLPVILGRSGLWFANILSVRNGLTGSGMDRKNRRHASAFAVRVSIRPLAPQRTSGGCHRERSACECKSRRFNENGTARCRYSAEVRLRIQSLGMQEILTAPRSPWQNPYAERLIGSIRRECLNHYIILNARHLKRTLSSYFRYYHQSRTHLSLDKQCPFPREALKVGKLVAIPQLGGLHHRYERIAA